MMIKAATAQKMLNIHDKWRKWEMILIVLALAVVIINPFNGVDLSDYSRIASVIALLLIPLFRKPFRIIASEADEDIERLRFMLE